VLSSEAFKRQNGITKLLEQAAVKKDAAFLDEMLAVIQKLPTPNPAP